MNIGCRGGKEGLLGHKEEILYGEGGETLEKGCPEKLWIIKSQNCLG